MQSASQQSLDIWHLAQDFAGPPVLSTEFIEDDTPLDRVIATPEEPHFLADFWFNFIAARPLPVHGTPGLIDHF